MLQDRQFSHYLTSAGIAFFAGAAGCALVLWLTGYSSESVSDNSIVSGTTDNQVVAVAEPATPPSDPDAQMSLQANASLERNDGLDELSALSVDDALKQANDERAQLASVLAQLTRQVETLEADAINQESLEILDQASGEQMVQAGNASDNRFMNESGPARTRQRRIDSLIASGVDADSAQALQERQDQYQLARLELFDQADREGWSDSDQLSSRLEELEEQRPDLRSELGDDAYDRYLFEAGRNNRVVFESVIPGSVAQIAGLAGGDMVISYADQRIFTTSDLQSATRGGVRGEPVTLNIERDGQFLFFEVQRGPLGVRLSASQRSPS